MGIKYALYPQFLTWQEGGVGTQHKKYGHEVPSSLLWRAKYGFSASLLHCNLQKGRKRLQKRLKTSAPCQN